MIRCLAFWSVVAAFWGMPTWVAGQSAEHIGRPITLQWDPNEVPPAGYIVYVGVQSQVYDEAYDVGSSTSFTYSNGIAGQRYYFAVAAYEPVPAVVGGKSSAISTIIPGAPTVIFLQPPLVLGSTVTLGWSNVGSTAVGEYILEAGSASGLNDLYTQSVGQLTSLTATVGPATYYVRLRGRTLAQTFGVSNEVIFSPGPAGCPTPPSMPTGVVGTVTSGFATLHWTPAPGATSYFLQVGSLPGLSDVFQGDIGASPVVTAPVPAGFTAYARVMAVNACGQSAGSAEVLVQ